jgi:V-type H+-transporting ATPase subunit a
MMEKYGFLHLNWQFLLFIKLVNEALETITKRSEHNLTATLSNVDFTLTGATPPTYIPVNDFTWAFQEIVNTYGIPRYQEINPALFSIVSFPFLFGIMFGDIGHGLVLTLFGTYLCLFKDSIIAEKSMIAPALKGRYLLLLMGIFAFYAGWLYNDFVSIPLDIFGSCYTSVGKAVTRKENCVYPIGIDPKWYVAENELAFLNSLKMKTSVVLGILLMSIGN